MLNADPKIIRALSDTVRAARIKMNLSQTEVARRAGIPRQNVVRIESGATMPFLPTLIAYGDAIGIPAWRLLRHAQRQLETTKSP